MHKSALRLLFDDYESSYRTLLLKANTPTMTVHSLRYLCGEIYTTVNGLNPSYMKNVFKKSDTSRSKQMQNQRHCGPTKLLWICHKNSCFSWIEKFGILFPLILSLQKRLKCLKNFSFSFSLKVGKFVEKYLWRSFVFSKIAGWSPTASVDLNFLAGTSQRFCRISKVFHFGFWILGTAIFKGYLWLFPCCRISGCIV